MSISLKKLNNGDYIRPKGKTWICPRCGNENVNQQISPKTRRIQKCSKCKLPKPMVFGVKVCTYCNSSDDVVLLPGFVHECPSCGSTQLKRFYPVTDDALKEGIHPKYASLKWQCECGHENPYPYANCLNCGAAIDKALNKMSADNNQPEERRNEIAQNMRLSNWQCPYCGRTNKGTEKVCPGCGNSGRSPEDDIINKIHPVVHSSSEISDPDKKQNTNQQIPEKNEKKRFEFHSEEIVKKVTNFFSAAISFASKVWWGFLILFMILLLMSNFKEEELTISDMKYNSSYIIQEYTTTHHTGEAVCPEGAYNIVQTQKSRHVSDDDDDDRGSNSSYDWDSGSDWGSSSSSDWDSGSDWGSNSSSDWDSGSDWGSSSSYDWDSGSDWGSSSSSDWGSDWDSGSDWGWNDYGGDYYDAIINIIHRLTSSIQNSTKKLLARIEYYIVYDYDVDEWVYSRTVYYSGRKDQLESTEIELNDKERIYSVTTSYIIYIDGPEKTYSLKVTEKVWRKLHIGDTIKVKTLFGNPQFITE